MFLCYKLVLPISHYDKHKSIHSFLVFWQMKKNLPKVLMLGWEFPPIINGGLGIACHDLSSAMSDLADITMIIPKSSLDFKVRNINLIGINNVDIKTLQLPSNYHKQKLPFKIHSISSNLNPYYSESSSDHKSKYSSYHTCEKSMMGTFDIDNLYGGDVINKVFEYADITSSLASKMDFDIRPLA